MVTATNLLVIALVTGAVSLIAMAPMAMDWSIYRQVATATLGMFFTQLVLSALGLLCSALFKKYQLGLFAAMGTLLLSYTIAICIEYSGNLDHFNFLSPIRYFNVQSVLRQGINLSYLLINTAIIALFLFFTLGLYRKRDFHT